MWYKIDFTKLAVQLLPPLLRSKFLTALLCVMIVPLRYLYGSFRKLKGNVDDRLNITGNVQYLETALNNAFNLLERQIYITTPEESNVRIFYFDAEGHPARILYQEEEEGHFSMWHDNENSMRVNFIVNVPTFLCTSLDREIDRYHWQNYNIIKNILSIYKPAGRTFGIELYDYE